MKLVTEPTAARAGSQRLGRAVVAAVAVAAVVLGAGIGLALHFLLPAPAAAPRSVIVNMRNGLYGAASWPVGALRAPAITGLHDQYGRQFTLGALSGHPVALVFFDSHCHQECPLEGRQLAAAELALPAGERPDLLVVSVNPKDTPASARRAIREWGLEGVSPWHWLMGTHAQLARVWARYHIQVSPPVDGDIAHTEALYLIDRRGYERAAYLWPFASRYATYDMRVLATDRGA
jgi:cytochrome oxidase Cu insertion factor (SCO1/SenC/PrrC family)